MEKINYEDLAKGFIDFYCDVYSIKECIEYLLNSDYSVEQMVELGFDKEDVEQVKKEMESENE